MDLQQTIDQLEQQAAQYTEAANALRTLLAQTGGATAEPEQEAAAAPKANRGRGGRGAAKAKAAKPAKAAAKPASGGGKRTVSPETRAKIAAAIRARHEARRNAQEA
ncbi:MAG TPA: hypothetical protein VF681_08225 [Abditibacteriaceae bacterium]